MRVMVLVKATPESETGVSPSEELFEAMGAFNAELVKAGVMLAADGLRPSSAGARVAFDRERRTVIDGPFAEAKELVAGYWIWQVASLDEAIEWVRRVPNPTGDQGVIEIRPIAELEDFDTLTPERREQLEQLAVQVADQQS